MKISVALCTYNGEKFLAQQIDSILQQTKNVDEIIVCDDGSTDKTIAILEGYQKEFPQIFKIFKNEKNLRSVKNFEKAISLCTGDFIFLSDQDDIWENNKVECLISYFNKNAHINCICSNGYLINEENQCINDLTIWEIPAVMKAQNIEVNYFNIIAFIENIATGAGMVFKRELITKIIPIPQNDGFHHDEWIALLSSSTNNFLMIEEKLFRYRLHSSQQVGGINYKNTPANKQRLVDHFNLFSENKSFSQYKKILKRLSQSYMKHSILAKANNEHNTLSIEICKQCKVLFNKNRAIMKKKYPIRSFGLQLIDNITKKRKID